MSCFMMLMVWLRFMYWLIRCCCWWMMGYFLVCVRVWLLNVRCWSSVLVCMLMLCCSGCSNCVVCLVICC